jgi:hypothetical protein
VMRAAPGWRACACANGPVFRFTLWPLP